MSIKVKQGLTKCLNQIADGTFDEETIRSLLILSREHLPYDGLIKELAHFVAHTRRDRGMFHKKLNNRYAKFKLVDERVNSISLEEVKKSVKTEDELSDFMLGGISVEQVESKLFKVLYEDGLEDLPEDHLLKHTGFKKSQVKEAFKKFYVKKDGFHFLITNKAENFLNAIKAMPNEKLSPEKEYELNIQLQKDEDKVRRIKATMKRLQEVVRGAIFFDSVFETKELYGEFETSFSQLIGTHGLGIQYNASITMRKDEILLCIMTLLHDSTFTFYDGNEARVFLCFSLTSEKETANPINSRERSNSVYESGVIALYLSYPRGSKGTSMPLFVSDLPIRKYLGYDQYSSNPSNSSMSEIPWITATRVGEELKLT
jgi:hypothetical protein